MENNYRPGDHKVHCGRCGKDYHASEMRREWTGNIVCNRCWEPRHPQEFLRATKDKIAADGLVRSKSDPTYVSVQCTTRSGVAGIAIAGCAIANNEGIPTLPSGTFGSGL